MIPTNQIRAAAESLLTRERVKVLTVDATLLPYQTLVAYGGTSTLTIQLPPVGTAVDMEFTFINASTGTLNIYPNNTSYPDSTISSNASGTYAASAYVAANSTDKVVVIKNVGGVSWVQLVPGY